MSSTVNNAFETEWAAGATHALQQMQSNLRSAVRVKKTDGNSSTVTFHKIGTGDATIDRPRHSDLTPMDVAHSTVSVTLKNIEAPEWIDDLDKIKTSLDLQNEYTTSIVGAINRSLETLILDAMDASATVVSDTNALDKAGLLLAHKALNANKVPMRDRFLAVDYAGLNDMLSDTSITNRDYIETKAMETGFVPNVLGFNVIYMEDISLLPEGSSGRKNFAFYKPSIGLAMGKEMQILTDRIGQKNLTQILGVMSANAVTIQSEGVVYVDVTTN